MSVSRLSPSTHFHQASSLVLALELRERLTDCKKETQDRWDEYHRNESVSHRHPTAFAKAVVSATVSFHLPHPDRAGPSTAPMEASNAPGIVQSANITTNDSVEPAATTVAAPAPSAMPEAPLAAAVYLQRVSFESVPASNSVVACLRTPMGASTNCDRARVTTR